MDDGLNYRTVAAETSVNLPTMFLKQVGITELVTPAVGTANETITDVEISLVLDNSGSMGSANRLDRLKEAVAQGDLGTGAELLTRLRVTLGETHLARAWYEGSIRD